MDSPRSRLTPANVIATLFIVGLAVAIIAPALGKVRETANKELCRNNLRTIAQACHKYHDDHDKLPPGYLGPLASKDNPTGHLVEPTSANGSHISVFAILLPYLDAGEVHKQIPQGEARNLFYQPKRLSNPDPAPRPQDIAGWWTVAEAVHAAKAKIKLFRCPSDNLQEDEPIGFAGSPPVVVAMHHYHTGAQKDPYQHMTACVVPWNTPGANELGVTNYFGVAGALGRGNSTGAFPKDMLPYQGIPTDVGWGFFEGILLNRVQFTLGQITAQDGTSNTLLFGESLGGISDGVAPRGERGRRETRPTWMGVGAMGVAAGMPEKHPNPWQPSSRHRVVQFAFGDGSVRGIRRMRTAFSPDYHYDWKTLMSLAGRRDGLAY